MVPGVFVKKFAAFLAISPNLFPHSTPLSLPLERGGGEVIIASATQEKKKDNIASLV